MDQHLYRLRYQVLAHSNDVRALCVMDNAIVSGSRDKTGKLWAEIRGSYESCATLSGHKSYISAICVLHRCPKLPLGLILTGGHDHKIFGYHPYTQEPCLTLEGHTGPVCCLTPSLKSSFVISSSWDCTAKIWDVCESACLFTIFGHTQTIWAVINIPSDYTITGSADQTIKVFDSKLQNMHTLTGHTDCVRGLSYLYDTLIISCSNDGSIRTWNVKDGTCLSVKQVHSNYIYSIKAVYEHDLIVAGCEDKIISIIHKGKQQNLMLPAQSIWAVDILPNLDIVTGSSDGFIRIFTTSVSRQASAAEQKAFENEVYGQVSMIASEVSSEGQYDGQLKPKVTSEVSNEGQYDGQLKFVLVLNKIKCFKWCQSNRKWLPVESGGYKEVDFNAGHHIIEGKVYDFIFDVYVEDDLSSPYKLPFIIGEHAFTIAEKFVCTHHLNPDYIKVVEDFLLLQECKTKVEVMGSPEITEKMLAMFSIPEKFIFFQKFEEATLKDRLDHYCTTQNLSRAIPFSVQFMKALTFSDETLDPMVIKTGVEEILTCIDMWPESIVYPVLDIARISLMRPKVHSYFFQEGHAPKFFNRIKQFMKESSSLNNRMLVCRILCNMFSSVEGINFVFANKEFIFSCLPMSKFSEKHKTFEIALASLLLNLSVEAINRSDSLSINLCFDISESVLMSIKEEEAVFRLLVAIGTLCLSLKRKIYPSRLFDQLKHIGTWKTRPSDASHKAARCASFLISQNVSLVLESSSKSED